MCKKPKHPTLANFLCVFSLSENVVIYHAPNGLENQPEDVMCDLLFEGNTEDLDPFYFEGKNPTWMKIRGMHVDFATMIDECLHIYVR